MRRKTRTKVNRILKILGIILGIIAIIIGVVLGVKLNKMPNISYDDILVGKNLFEKITINYNSKEVLRDNIQTTLIDEFGVSEEEQNLIWSQEEELSNFLNKSVFEISVDSGVYTITNPFQTKKIIVEAEEIKELVKGEEIVELQDGIFILSFYSEKLTSVMYEYYKDKDYIKNIFLDEVYINKETSDVSQTMYGGIDADVGNYHSLGALTLGLDNYHKIITENGNPKEIIISTIGYGINSTSEFFKDRLYNEGYNFVLENRDISETISQGSRIAEILVDSTTNNVKIMPLVVVTDEGYTSVSSIIRAIVYATKNTDIICYELLNKPNKAIDLVLENAFRENIPVCTISTALDEESYPANHAMTIATSSLNRENEIASYSGKGDYIDFALPSTDVVEIFNSSSSISRWSGSVYSNAQIVAEIALIKTYNKDATILEIYNFLRNFCLDLGESGKDELYGYGMPVFTNLTISDIDKEQPKFLEVTYENETWEVLKQVKIKANDNIRIYRWGITKNEQEPEENEWKILESVTPDLDVTTELTENGKYYIYIQDTAGNIIKEEIQIDKIDNIPPQIAYTINKDSVSAGYVTINVSAQDSESGLYDSPFSWDKITWSQENSVKTVTQNGRYKVYAVDNLGNISEQEILVNVFPQEGTAQIGEGDIINSIYVSSEWNGNINSNVQIKLNGNLNLKGWQITQLIDRPNEFIAVNIPENENTNNNTINQTENLTNTNTTNNNTTNETTNTTEDISNTTNDISNTVIVNRGTNEPIEITQILSTDTLYYLWIEDADGNARYQTFSIAKAII